MSDKPETVFITKYALTDGILEREVESITHDGVAVVKAPLNLNSVMYYYGDGKEWHRTREGAVKRAEEMKAKKIASLRQQIAKLEKKEF